MTNPWAHVLDIVSVAALASAMRPHEFPRARKLVVRKRVMAHAQAWTAAQPAVLARFATPSPPMHVVRLGAETSVLRADSGEWRAVLPGVQLKRLHHDDATGSITALWRLDAGAHIPPHHHGLDEECLVLEGSVQIEGKHYGIGDFMLAGRGTDHTAVRSVHGALLMIRGGDPFAEQRAG